MYGFDRPKRACWPDNRRCGPWPAGPSSRAFTAVRREGRVPDPRLRGPQAPSRLPIRRSVDRVATVLAWIGNCAQRCRPMLHLVVSSGRPMPRIVVPRLPSPRTHRTHRSQIEPVGDENLHQRMSGRALGLAEQPEDGPEQRRRQPGGPAPTASTLSGSQVSSHSAPTWSHSWSYSLP